MSATNSERPKLLKNLTIPQIVKIAKDVYGIEDLNTKQRKETLVARVRESMLLEQDCGSCMGECDPESHAFLPQQFSIIEATVNSTFAADLAEFLASKNVSTSTDSPVGDQTTPFVESHESIQRLLTAATKHLGESRQPEPEAGGGSLGAVNGPDATTSALVQLLQQQQAQQQNQNKLLETMVNVISGGQRYLRDGSTETCPSRPHHRKQWAN